VIEVVEEMEEEENNHLLRCQFHQRFSLMFFVRKFVQTQTLSREKTFVQKICAKNVDEIDYRSPSQDTDASVVDNKQGELFRILNSDYNVICLKLLFENIIFHTEISQNPGINLSNLLNKVRRFFVNVDIQFWKNLEKYILGPLKLTCAHNCKSMPQKSFNQNFMYQLNL